MNNRSGIFRNHLDQPEDGSTTVQVFVLLVFLTVLLAGGGMAFAFASRSARDRIAGGKIEERLLEATDLVIAALREDPTPAADSKIDPVWRKLPELSSDGVTVTLEDASSAINLNWIGKNLFSKTELKAMFRPGKNEEQLQQYREDTGFHADPGTGYGAFIAPEDLENLCTTYGYANVNVTDEFALRKLAALRTGSETVGEQFRARIQDALRAKKIVTKAELRAFLGSDYVSLFPIVNAEPVYNVHFLPERILRAIVSYPDYEVPDSLSAAVTIASIRDSGELTSDRLRAVLRKEPPHRIHEYLGTVTWFWRIVAEYDTMRMLTIVARIPEESASGGGTVAEGKTRFDVLERRVTK